jgi:hypothetical protein
MPPILTTKGDHMKKIISIAVALSLITIVGCNQEENEEIVTEDVNYARVKNETGVDQAPSKKAVDIVKDREETTEVKAVNSINELYVAFNVETLERFQLDKIEAEVKKQLEKEFPNMKVEVSTDSKVFQEIEAVERKLKDNKVNGMKDLNKSLEHIKFIKNDE